MTLQEAGELTTEEEVLLGEGLARFDTGRYWHAHESWEDLWNALKRRSAPSEEVLLVQGLIQTAALLLHYENRKERGVTNQWLKLEPKLAGWTVAWGLDIELHCSVIREFANDVGYWTKNPTSHQIPRA
ncbi:DUF309 domain-containing protein [Candidatus Poseidonia alphae]|nr:DUF309 domain-containing protein [Candidatus Poseidonia alphae]